MHTHPNSERSEKEIIEEIVQDIIDLEAYAKKKTKPPKAKGYRIKIDKEYKEVFVHEMTGKEILALVNKTPEEYNLSQKLHGGSVEPVEPNQTVVFHQCEIERFQTLAKDPTEG